jgi:hypothetical protein
MACFMRINMKRKMMFILIVILLTVKMSADDLTSSLLNEFEAAGIDLRVDRDEVLRAELKVFDGFIEDPERAFFCGIKTVKGGKLEKGSIVFFNIQENGELRQIFLGHVVLKRRYKKFDPENQPEWKALITAEERISGLKLCQKEDKKYQLKTK